MNGSISGRVSAWAGNGSTILTNEHVQPVHLLGSDAMYTVYSTEYEVEPSRKMELILEVDAGGVNEYVLRYPPAVVSVNFRECPLGFSMHWWRGIFVSMQPDRFYSELLHR